MSYMIKIGDCVEVMRSMRAESIDAIVTDPPYELGIVGAPWDSTGITFRAETWREMLRVLKHDGCLLSFGGTRTYHRMAVAVEDGGFTLRDCLAWMYGKGVPKTRGVLKPAFEPIVLATRGDSPLRLNVEACRIEFRSDADRASAKPQGRATSGRIVGGIDSDNRKEFTPNDNSAGRWPANVILDDESAELVGAPSRFFYCTKASRLERGEGNTHPTVKPIALMRWLVRLVAPPGGIIVDPFMGSGTTGVAALREGFHFLGIEREESYAKIAESRISAAATLGTDRHE